MNYHRHSYKKILLRSLLTLIVGTICLFNVSAQDIPGLEIARDQGTAQRLVQVLWAHLTSSPCWAVPNSTQQYVFFGQFQYRYDGFDTTMSGTIRLANVFTYYGKPGAIVKTWDDDNWIGVVAGNSETISIIDFDTGNSTDYQRCTHCY